MSWVVQWESRAFTKSSVTALSRRDGGASVHLAMLDVALAGERQPRVGRVASAGEQVDRVAADRGTVLEAVAGAGTDDQHVRPARMPVDHEVAVRAVLVLANARLRERPLGQRRGAPPQVRAHVHEPP